MANKRRLVTTRDIVIPAGTEVGPAPTRSHYVAADHGEILVAINKDSTGMLRLHVGDALADGLVKETE